MNNKLLVSDKYSTVSYSLLYLRVLESVE